MGDDVGSMLTRAIVLLIAGGLGALCARAVWNFLRDGGPGKTARRMIGHQERAPWASNGWACGRCHTVNRHTRRECERCRSPRESTEMAFAQVATEPDIIPASIPAGAGAIVTLEHNSAAHTEGLNGHWRLRVNSVIVGSAARRDGAVALLRAVEGANAVLFDPRGAGIAPYPISALIAAFESPKLPLSVPCPEQVR
jgi:hypothetical protein